MPPHCDAMDGPVVKAAMRALALEDVKAVLPFVPQEGEKEVTQAYEKVALARKDGGVAREVADLYFFETVVRIHRAGEGAPYTGLKPEGLDVGPVIPLAEEAIESGSPERLIRLLTTVVESELEEKFRHVIALRSQATGPVDQAREYVGAMLGFIVQANTLYQCATADVHAAHGAHVD